MPYVVAVIVLAAISAVAAMITHIGTCIATANWILLLFGLFVFPVGIIHGWMIWLGFA